MASASLCFSSRWRNRRMVLSSGSRPCASSCANWRYSGTSKKRLLHRRVRQAEPLLQKMRAQHRLQYKRWPARASLGVIRCDERNQPSPRNDALHLLEKFAFAGLSGVQVQLETCLLCKSQGCHGPLTSTKQELTFCRVSLRRLRFSEVDRQTLKYSL